MRARRTTRYSVCGVCVALAIGWGACPRSSSAQENRRQPVADPFLQFKKGDPAPIPLLPTEVAWTLTLPAPPSAPAAMDAQHIYVPLRDARLVALDRERGTQTWARTLHTGLPPLSVGGFVYVAQGAAVRALDAGTGEDRWAVVLDNPPLAPFGHAGQLLLSVIAPGELVALDARNGDIVWRRSVGSATLQATVANGDTAYLSTVDSRVFAIALADGQIRWDVTLPGILSAPVVAGDRVFVGSTDNALYAFDADNGALRWRMPGGGDVIGSAPDSGLIYYVSLDNVVRALNQGNGNQRWREESGTRPLFPPLALGGLVIVPGILPAAAVFNGRTGAPIGTISVAQGTTLFGPPLVDRAPAPRRTSIVTLTREGGLTALQSAPLLFREPAPAAVPLALPGRLVPREVVR